MELPLTAQLPSAEREADDLLDDARALVESYGVRAVTRLERARSAGAGDRRGRRRRATPSWWCWARRGAGSGARAPIFGSTGRLRAEEQPLAGARGGAAGGTQASHEGAAHRPGLRGGARRARRVAVVAGPSRSGVGGGLGLLLGGLMILGGALRIYLWPARWRGD